MSFSEVCIYSGGVLSAGMAVFHSRFYTRFHWKDDFKIISFRNQKILYTVHIALLLFFCLFALLSFIFAKELALSSGLALGINILYSLFWLWRTIWQVFYFRSPPEMAVNSKSAIHYIITIVFFLLFVSYFLPVFIQWDLIP